MLGPTRPLERDRAGNMAVPSAAEPSPEPLDAAAPAPYWTDFRGPNRLGLYEGDALDLDWPAEGLEPLWKISVGPAYSSAVVAGGLVVTLEQRRELQAKLERRRGRHRWH